MCVDILNCLDTIGSRLQNILILLILSFIIVTLFKVIKVFHAFNFRLNNLGYETIPLRNI